jgi:hypothetical protein
MTANHSAESLLQTMGSTQQYVSACRQASPVNITSGKNVGIVRDFRRGEKFAVLLALWK